MESDEVRVAREGGVIMLTIDRPDDRHRFSSEVIATLQDLGGRLATDEQTQAVVLTEGRPPRFTGR